MPIQHSLTTPHTQQASQRWDRLALAAALAAGQCRKEDLEALVNDAKEKKEDAGSPSGARAGIAREFARRVRAAAAVVLKGLEG